MIYRMIRVCAEGLDLTVKSDGYTQITITPNLRIIHYKLGRG